MKRWGDLSERNRRIITVVAIVEAALKAWMLLDLKRRPADEVRGSKRLWAFSSVVNSAGVVPLSYFVFGRRRTPAKA
jgi:hypothetical protein